MQAAVNRAPCRWFQVFFMQLKTVMFAIYVCSFWHSLVAQNERVCDRVGILQIDFARGHLFNLFQLCSLRCSRKCSFCTIPAIRGAFRSKPLDAAVAEARELAQNGAAELSIIAQDSSNYGNDIGLKNGPVTLIKELEKMQNLVSFDINLQYFSISNFNFLRNL